MSRQEMPVKVSVIVPVYNSEEYLAKCLDSLLAQTLRETEIICINDGSTDGSRDILDTYSQKDERIVILDQKNQGQGAARNAGMDAARGAYIAFVDSDDWLDEEALKNLYEQARQGSLELLYFSGATEFETKEIRENHKPYFDRAYKRDKVETGICDGRTMLKRQRDVKQYWRVAYMVLIERAFLEKHGIRFTEGSIHEDNLFAFELCLFSEKADVTATGYYHRLLHENSTITKKTSLNNLYGYINAIIEETRILRNEERDLAELGPFYDVIHDTIRSCYETWTEVEESERIHISEYFSRKEISLSERDLFYALVQFHFSGQDKLDASKKKLREAEKKNREQETKLLRIDAESREKDNEKKQLEKTIDEIRHSRTYRIGQGVLFPVRMIRKLRRLFTNGAAR